MSVVIPAYHSAGSLAGCLEALRAQTFRDFEVVLVNSSPDDTPDIVRRRFPEVVLEQSPVRLLPQAARNRGVEHARGELIAFTDPDCRADPAWLERLVDAYERGHGAVGGSMDVLRRSWFELGVHLAKFYWLLPTLPAGRRRVVCSANVAYSRTLWEEIGPFDDTYTIGDALLSWRAAAAGPDAWFEPGACVRHRHDRTAREYWAEFRTRGRELAEARIELELWSRRRAAAYAVLAPAVLAVVLLRAGRASVAAGWGRTFLATLPVQLFCKLAWTLGETSFYYRFARRLVTPRPLRAAVRAARPALRT